MTGHQPLPHEGRPGRIREAVASFIQRLRLRLTKSSSEEPKDEKGPMAEDPQRVLSPILLPLPPIYRPYTRTFQPRPTKVTIRLPQPVHVAKGTADPPLVSNPRRQPPVMRRRRFVVDRGHRNSQPPRGWVYPITPPPSPPHRVTVFEEFFLPFSPICRERI